ncbi:MAG TPA: hypothetical protein VMT53_21115 [Terriglobales bacterium]|nr:hypothetical protein [Terriglobales bacterium]
MKHVSTLAFVVVCVAGASVFASATDKKDVKGSGCVEKVAENSCRVIIDSQTGELYNLMFSGGAPRSGTAIQFEGTVRHAGKSCSTGKPVKVSKWTKEKGIKCPPPVAALVGR